MVNGKEWVLKETGFNPERNADNGNRYLIGNGYMGVRGTLEEFTKAQLVAVNLSGLYDKVGDGWREPLNAPNALYGLLEVEGESYDILTRTPAEHELCLNYGEGILYRKTGWVTAKGKVVLETERFAEMENPHYLRQRYAVTVDYDCDICVITGIDGDVWDIYGPHYQEMFLKQVAGTLCAEGFIQERRAVVRVQEEVRTQIESTTPEKIEHIRQVQKEVRVQIEGMPIQADTERGRAEAEVAAEITSKSTKVIRKEVVQEKHKLFRKLSCSLKAGETFVLTKIVNIDINPNQEEMGGQKKVLDYPAAKAVHIAHWQAYWAKAAVIIEGDDEAMAALNYSLYHLHSVAPRHSKDLSIPARGLSGQTYKGAVFWDTEMFMLPFFLYTDVTVARALIRYRLNTLPGAMKKAAEYGYEGAFYAWESQEGGFEACSDYNVIDVFTGRPMRTYFRDKQIHISAAIVYAIMRYSEISGDRSIWREGGLETVLECARFYYGLLVKKVAGEYYELRDVIGPDEYHERVNNNGYTNRMAKYTLEAAARLLKQLAEIVPAEGRAGSESVVSSQRRLSETVPVEHIVGNKSAMSSPTQLSKMMSAEPSTVDYTEQTPPEPRKPGQNEEKTSSPPLTDWETAQRIRGKYPVAELQRQFTEAAARIYLPEPDENGILPQFDGYMALEDVSVERVKGRLLHEKEYWGGAYGVAAETKVIKQADVVTWLTLFAAEHRPEILNRNWHYYEPRTEHGSSLSACMYAWLACLCQMPDRAYPFFMKSALADWKGGGKQWAGLVYIGGSHLAAAGGAYINAIHGFAGVSFTADELKITPRFPKHWHKMKFSLDFRGKTHNIEITRKDGKEEEYNIHTQIDEHGSKLPNTVS